MEDKEPDKKFDYQKHIRITDPKFVDEIMEAILFNDLEAGQFVPFVKILLRREIKRMNKKKDQDSG